MKKIILSAFVLIACLNLLAQQQSGKESITLERKTELPGKENASGFAETITQGDLQTYVTNLASTEFEGRETGTVGQARAAAYLAEQFQRLGLQAIGDSGTFLQKIKFMSESWVSGNINLAVNGEPLLHLKDFYSEPVRNNHRESISIDEIVFLGYGINSESYNDYAGKELAGKDILILTGEPVNSNGISWITKNREPSAWSNDISLKVSAAYKQGVRTVFVADGDFTRNLQLIRRSILNSRMTSKPLNEQKLEFSNSLVLSTPAIEKIAGTDSEKINKALQFIQKNGQPSSFTFKTDLALEQQKSKNQLECSNVLGYIQGSDSVLSKEIVVLSAHYDHLGKRGDRIYYGADDNASGTSAILEIAQAFQEAKNWNQGPRRSILFLLVSGEEKGLLGSQYYTEYPVLPLSNTIVNLNVDMIGRRDAKYKNNPGYIYVIGADRLSTTLHKINELANTTFTKLTLDYTYNDRNDPQRLYYRSDHYSFAKNKIPSIFYFSGLHEDYHQTSDTVDKIEFDKMVPITQLIFYTAWDIANRNEKPRVDVFEE